MWSPLRPVWRELHNYSIQDWRSVRSWLGFMCFIASVLCWRASCLFVVLRQSSEQVMSVNWQAVAQCGGSPAVCTRRTLACSLYFSMCLLCFYLCVSMNACTRMAGRAQPQDLEKEWAYWGSILSHTLMLWPRPGLLWFPWSEVAAALIFSSKLYHSSIVSGQESRRVGSADHSKNATVVERQSGPWANR